MSYQYTPQVSNVKTNCTITGLLMSAETSDVFAEHVCNVILAPHPRTNITAQQHETIGYDADQCYFEHSVKLLDIANLVHCCDRLVVKDCRYFKQELMS